jgi:hypothetical protein
VSDRAAPRPRRWGWRRLLAVPVAAGLLLVGGKLVTMFAFAASGADAYSDGGFERSETSFRRLDTLNVVDPWRAHLGLGDARYRQGDLLGAGDAFRRALELAPERCEIRFNLAVTIEAQGDRLAVGAELDTSDTGGQPAANFDRRKDPAERYSVALGIVDAGECPAKHADDVGERLAETRVRLVAKLLALDAVAPADEGPEPEEPTDSDRGDSEQIDELEVRNDSGARQREEARDLDTSGRGPDGRSDW